MTRPARSRFPDVAYAHTQKPEWGAALIAWEEDGKRGYRFEDGELRVFKEGYFDRLAIQEISAERLARLRATLPETAAIELTPPPVMASGSGMSVDEQLDYFLRTFPGGFTGEAWQARSQGRADRAAAVARAQKDFDRHRLRKFIVSKESEPCVTEMCALLASTDLITPKELGLLDRLPYYTTSVLAECLVDLLWSDQEPILSFAAWSNILTKATGGRPSWILTTAPLALLRPDQHVAVKSTSFVAQAQISAPALRLDRTPAWAMYERALAMAKALFEDLDRAGARPRNLLDVHDFIVMTQRPKIRGEILSQRGR